MDAVMGTTSPLDRRTGFTVGPECTTTIGDFRIGSPLSLVVIALIAIAERAGVPMDVAESSTKPPEHIPLPGYGTVILGSTLVGLLLATAFGRWTRRLRRAFVVTELILTAVSFAFPATTTAPTATKVVLEVTHVIPAALIIPAIAALLPARRARRVAA